VSVSTVNSVSGAQAAAFWRVLPQYACCTQHAIPKRCRCVSAATNPTASQTAPTMTRLQMSIGGSKTEEPAWQEFVGRVLKRAACALQGAEPVVLDCYNRACVALAIRTLSSGTLSSGTLSSGTLSSGTLSSGTLGKFCGGAVHGCVVSVTNNTAEADVTVTSSCADRRGWLARETLKNLVAWSGTAEIKSRKGTAADKLRDTWVAACMTGGIRVSEVEPKQ
jgi:hypothetical protein